MFFFNIFSICVTSKYNITKFSALWRKYYWGQIWIIFGAGTALINDATWDEFSEQHQHQSTIFNAQVVHFKGESRVQIYIHFALEGYC